MELAHLVGTAMQNHNPNKMSLEKRVKEWECVAWFVDPKYLSCAFIKGRFYKAVYELYRRNPSNSWFWFLVGIALIKVRLFGARGRSSYR